MINRYIDPIVGQNLRRSKQMKKEFNIHYWNINKYKLKKIYPQLTDADLLWRHETEDDLFQTIAERLGMKKTQLEEIIASF